MTAVTSMELLHTFMAHDVLVIKCYIGWEAAHVVKHALRAQILEFCCDERGKVFRL